MSQQQPSAPADQTLNNLIGQLHATLVEILQQQNDRIARLEAEPDGVAQKVTDALKEGRKKELDTVSVDSEVKKEQLESATFNQDDYAMVMSVWPDPGQAVVTKTSSKLA
jgi:uncharacterized protein (UPF0335 family)